MSEWKNFSLGDVCNTISETYHRKSEQVILINTSDVLNGKILNHDSVPNENLKGQFKKTFQRDDILFSEIRPINRRCAFIDFEDTQDYIASTKLMVLRANKEVILPRYLYFFLTAENVLRELQHLAETRSGTFPQITFDSELAPFPINLPPLETQKKIAAVLSALDDKIELNNAINKNLEEQAQAIYKHMFVDNFNPAWQRGTLSDISEITMGQSPSGKSYNENGIGTIFFQGRTDFGFRFPTTRMFTTEPKRIASKNDIMFSVRAPVGDYNIALEKCCIGRGLAALSAKNNYQSFLFYTLPHLKQQLEIYNGQGTVFGAINQQELKKIKVDIPEQNLINKFEKIVNPMDEIILNNHLEDQKLAEIRDALLPRLMSGEIDVSSIEI